MSQPAAHRAAPPFALVVALLLLSVLLAAAPAGATGVLDPFSAPLEPPGTGGVERADRALAKLPVHRRVLVIGAHPDDEDTTLLALVARGLGGEAAYLSLSRGEGGQNLIGPELGPALGLIRSRELLAARQIDGARQFFTRAYDFGYTRSLAETHSLWPADVLLEDAVRVIRRFRPQVMVSVFPPDSRAGHGQHQAAGVVALEAFHRAGDPAAFPRLAAEGLAPWQPDVLYRSTWWEPPSTTLTLPLGVLEPYAGRSVLQLALASRSRHRSQDMGMLQPLGPGEARLAWVAGAGGPDEVDLFAGVGTELAALAELLPAGDARAEV
ncbi:MAG TPA: PIG-L family deacetylase, partial [Thermoanaerobaculia bacterium]|nr:PIG-L family deacetylase [Thermoanaerobaculia bacterium]